MKNERENMRIWEGEGGVDRIKERDKEIEIEIKKGEMIEKGDGRDWRRGIIEDERKLIEEGRNFRKL